MNALNELLAILKIEANVHHNGQYCGDWAVDISGSRRMSFHVVSKGQCFFNFENQTIELKEGDAVFMPSDAQHCVSNFRDSEVKKNQARALAMTDTVETPSTGLVCGNFTHQHPVFEKLVTQMPRLIIVRHNENGPTQQVIKLLINESRVESQHSSVLLNRLADCLFYLLLRNNLDIDNGMFAAFAHPNLSNAIERIHENSSERLTLDELANAAAMSRSAFSSLFKEVVGQTPIEYLTQWRMAQAYSWFTDENISTSQAAIRCGYESEASFSKAFKRVMGMNPGVVRSGMQRAST